MSEYGNLEILGVGKSGGGRFNKVLIAGSGKIEGALECEEFSLPGAGSVSGGGLIVHGKLGCYGAGKAEGPVRAGEVEICGSFKAEAGLECAGRADVSGSLKIEGPCSVGGDLDLSGSFKTEGACTVSGKSDISGSLKCEGDLSVRELDASGAVHVGGSLAATEVDLSGVLNVGREVQAEHFRAEGTVKIGGLLNADTVELGLVGEDRIESIGGGSVRVWRARSRVFGLFGSRPHLSAGLIEADEIDLEYTDCETVRGVNVRIGPECVIDRVEYSGILTTDANCSIGEKVKI